MSEADGARGIALGLAAELLGRLRDPAIRELEVRRSGIRVKVSRDPHVAAAPIPEPDAPSAGASLRSGSPPAASAAAPVATKTVTASLTGVFYRSASPQGPPFVQGGSVVAVGDVIGLIEAMKLFNEVRSTVAGRVRRIVAENGQLVRAHQPLVELE